MGVVPQFDILWDDLTGFEHMEMFGHIKGIYHAEEMLF
jgi:ABC-type multidrug transport system ATPase subunit